jgi:hypothetical protein
MRRSNHTRRAGAGGRPGLESPRGGRAAQIFSGSVRCRRGDRLASFEQFRRSDCAVDTSFAQDTKADVLAFAEFKLKFEIWRTCTDNPVARICSSESRRQLEQK